MDEPSQRDRILDFWTKAARLLPIGRMTAHRIMWRLLGAPRRFLGKLDGQWFCVDAADLNISMTTYIRDGWEPPVSAVCVAVLEVGNVFVDVGANKGWFSMLAAKRVGGNGRVISYEPVERNHLDISATIAANGYDNWIVRSVAVSNESGTATLYSPDEESGTGWGTLTGRRAPSDITTKVPTVTLAEDLSLLGVETVDLLKMDIQGHELAALKGASPMIKSRAIKNLLVEIHAFSLDPKGIVELFALMMESGYTSQLLKEDKHISESWRRSALTASAETVKQLWRPIAGPTDRAVAGEPRYHVLFALGK